MAGGSGYRWGSTIALIVLMLLTALQYYVIAMVVGIVVIGGSLVFAIQEWRKP